MAKSMSESLKKLTDVFRKLGADDPESWARSQIEEGIPQFARFVFLKQAWRAIPDEKDQGWIDRLVTRADDNSNEPCAGLGPALKRMLAKGVDRQDIVDVVRCLQYEMLFALCYQMSDPGVVDFLDDTMPSADWGLFQLNKDGEPTEPLGGLHESVLSMDPTGREMRPRKKP